MAEAVVPALLFIKYYRQFLPPLSGKNASKFSMRYKRKRYNGVLFPVISSRQKFLLLLKNFCEKKLFITTNVNISNSNNGKKEDHSPIFKERYLLFKERYLFNYLSELVSLFLSGRITLKVIFYYFHHYLFEVYKCINENFEKPNSVLFQEYRCTPLFLHLGQWHIANEAESLIQLHYARIKRNPE